MEECILCGGEWDSIQLRERERERVCVCMSVRKTTIEPGDGVTFPKKDDECAVHCTFLFFF